MDGNNGIGTPMGNSGSNELVKDAQVKVFIAKDRLTAYIVLEAPIGGGNIATVQKMTDALAMKGIKYGVDSDALKALETAPAYGREIPVAKGAAPKSGTDGKIEYLFNIVREKKPQILEDGRVDYHDLGFVQNVYVGNELANIIDPIEGTPGTDVFGNTLPVKAAKKALVPKGKNVGYSADGKKLVAQIDGQVTIIDGKISVMQQIEINGNVDASTGDINFVGNVVVKGNVITGFKLEASGTVEVYGVVEGAFIKAQGDVILKKGSQGMGKASIVSGGDVLAKYIENATVEARGNIKCDAIMHSNIKCNGVLELEGKKGLIVGGVAKVGSEVIAKVIGSPMATVTELQVGVLPEETENLRNLKEQVAKLSDDLIKTEQVITLLNKLKEASKLTKEKEDMLLKSVRSKVIISNNLNQIKAEAAELENKVSAEVRGKIKAQKIHPGVTITMGSSKKFIKETCENCLFYEENSEIRSGYL